MKSNLTAIVLTKNNEKLIAACLETLQFCEKIIIVDANSTDKTVQIAENYNSLVINFDHPSFAKRREKALDLVKTDWLIYIDSDERVSPALAREILSNIKLDINVALTFSRKNICYGYPLNFGAWQYDFVTRAFNKAALKGWQGDIHEGPIYSGTNLVLNEQLLHLTHRNTEENLRKSADWTIKEAELLVKKHHQAIGLATIFRKGIMEFYRRALKNKGYKDKMPGLIEALVQAINRMIVYIQVWELQQRPSLEERYQEHERKIAEEWRKAKL